MTTKMKQQLDAVDRTLLELLQKDGRASFADLGRAIGLTGPATAARVHALEERGVIRGYRAQVDPAVLGYGVAAFVQLEAPATGYMDCVEAVRKLPGVTECHLVAGRELMLMRLHARSMQELTRLVDGLTRLGATTTQIIFSSPIECRPLAPAD